MQTFNNFERDFPPNSMIFYDFEHFFLNIPFIWHFYTTMIQNYNLSYHKNCSPAYPQTQVRSDKCCVHPWTNSTYYYTWDFFSVIFNEDKIGKKKIIPKYMTYHQALQFCIFSWLKNKLQNILTTHRDHLDMLLLQKIEHYTNYWSLKHTQNITSYL